MAFNAWQFGMMRDPGDTRSELDKYLDKLRNRGLRPASEAAGTGPITSASTPSAAGGTPDTDPRFFDEEITGEASGTGSGEPYFARHQPRALLPWEHQICDRVKQVRRELKLSQPQLARVLNTSLRSVKRWEAHKGKPVARVRQFLGFLERDAKENGLPAFIEHYVREEPRYQKPGPASSLAENSFDSRVRGESPSAFVIGLAAEDPFKD